jgi:hypothetical protein
LAEPCSGWPPHSHQGRARPGPALVIGERTTCLRRAQARQRLGLHLVGVSASAGVCAALVTACMTPPALKSPLGRSESEWFLLRAGDRQLPPGRSRRAARRGHHGPQASASRRPGKARVGDIVLAVGNPIGLTGSVTDGIISATGRPVTGQAGPGSPNATLLAPSRPAHHAHRQLRPRLPGLL